MWTPASFFSFLLSFLRHQELLSEVSLLPWSLRLQRGVTSNVSAWHGNLRLPGAEHFVIMRPTQFNRHCLLNLITEPPREDRPHEGAYVYSILRENRIFYFFSFNNSFILSTGNLSSISTTSNKFNGSSFSPISERYSVTALRSIIIFPCPAQ